MTVSYELKPNQLYIHSLLKPDHFKKQTSQVIIGQEKAIEALKFGLSVHALGYNIFCAGPKGVGRTTITQSIIKDYALKQKAPLDWCYVHNFDVPQKPIALSFPAGDGKVFVKNMQKLVAKLKENLIHEFNDDAYHLQIASIEKKFQSEKQDCFGKLQSSIEGGNVTLMRMPTGVVVAPTLEGEILNPDKFNALPLKQRKSILEQMGKAQKKLEQTIKDLPNWEGEQKKLITQLQTDIARGVLYKTFHTISLLYDKKTSIQNFFKSIQKNVLENISFIVSALITPQGERNPQNDFFNFYRVNLIVSHNPNQGAPVLNLENVTIQTLLGKIERVQQSGSLTTDFMLIKPGALMEANGGYLIIEARDILANPKLWQILKHTLFTKKIMMESGTESNSVFDMVSLEPSPIPITIKIILIGDSSIYFNMVELDESFAELFKVYVHFFEKSKRTLGVEKEYAQQLMAFTQNEKLKELSLEAIKRLIEYASRLSNEQDSLTLYMTKLRDIIREASSLTKGNKALIGREQIDQAISLSNERVNFNQIHLFDFIQKGVLSLSVSGEKVGQINALAVQKQGDFIFGRPNRITCQIRLGKGDFIDIEREVELGGPIHSKGVLILSSFLASRFSMTTPLCLDASLVFEQSYLPVEGDSASAAELYCLLSAISDIPLKQGIAVTGSVNQLGQIQAVGAINEKIEGYFDVCQMLGLTGKQGVLIPKTNIQNLMLKAQVVDAVRQHKFHIFAIETIDEGIKILTGLKAGKLTKNGFEKLSVNERVSERLKSFFDLAQKKGSLILKK